MDSKQLKTLIASLVGFIALIFIGIFAYRTFFLVLDSNNVSGTIPDSLASINLNFNKPIDPGQNFDEAITVTPALRSRSVLVTKNGIEVHYNFLDSNTRYTVKIKDIRSTDGKTLSTTLNFQTKYIQYDQLTKAQQENEVAGTNEEFKKFPVLNELPYEDPNFKVEGTITNDQKSVTYTITLFAVYNRPDQFATYKADLKTYKTAALDWLSKQGVDISTAQITYQPDDPDKL